MTTTLPSTCDLRKVIIGSINEQFSYGQYGMFQIIIMNSNSYVNATKLCRGSLTNKTRSFRNWLKLEASTVIINHIEQIWLGQNGDEVVHAPFRPSTTKAIIKVNHGHSDNLTRGTYVHPLLVTHIASWYDPIYAVEVSLIVSDFHTRKLQDEVRLKNHTIVEKDDVISKLQAQLDYIRNSTDQIIQDNKITHEKLDNVIDEKHDIKFALEQTKDELGLINDKLDVAEQNIERVQDKLDIAVVDRVPRQKYPSKNEQFFLLKPLPKEEDARYDYYVIRGQKDYARSKLNRFLKDFPLTDILLSIDYQPNSRNLYIRLKQSKKSKLLVGLNWFSLKDWNEEDMINTIQSLNDDKYNVQE